MNMDNYIQSLIDSGMTLDEVGRELSCALNRKQKEIDEADKFERHREGLIDNVNAAVDVNVFDLKTAASAATLAMIDGGYIKGTAQAETFFEEILHALEKEPEQAPSRNKREDEKVVRYATGSDTEKILRFLRQLGL